MIRAVSGAAIVNHAAKRRGAGLAHHLRDDISRFLEGSGQLLELRFGQLQGRKRHGERALGDRGRRLPVRGQIRFGLFGAVQELALPPLHFCDDFVGAGVLVGKPRFEGKNLVLQFVNSGRKRLARLDLCIALESRGLKPLLRLAQEISERFNQGGRAKQILRIAAGRHQVGEPAQEPQDFSGFRRWRQI
ncbi:MAG TPA: hypothetical protein VFL62_09975 [Bradyrhizobium sp.]|uniref:hypothetical protein n=1 Tax=Bradyrhizobium sp. TaxID=376 RepID=UPI002D7F43C3|nr:hypothetical protein [Bradyrhizobium sp.]HET7886541.1 hypothetical protein [Bradyrhizobium sp.]